MKALTLYRTTHDMYVCESHKDEAKLKDARFSASVVDALADFVKEECVMCRTKAVEGRTCHRCDAALHPRWPGVYCSNACALAPPNGERPEENQ